MARYVKNIGFRFDKCGLLRRVRFQDESHIMLKRLLCTSFALILLPQATQANDIVDFFKAISGPSPRVHTTHRHHEVERNVSRRAIDRRAQLAERRQFGASYAHPAPGVAPTSHRVYSPGSLRSSRTGRSGLSFHVSIGNQSPVVSRRPTARYDVPYPTPTLPAPPLPMAPLPGQFSHLPHQLGDIVTCSVPVYSHVHVKRACRVAPNAVPTLIAVRDPSLGRFRSCVEQMVYVEVLAPPCPPRLVRVSPCRTRIKMDYGRYEVLIESRNGCVTVEYDN